MATERLDYPTASSPTTSWTPALNAFIAQTSEEIDEGIITDQSAGAQQYRYNEGKRVRLYKRGYSAMSESDRTSFLAFVAAALGAAFEFTDYNSAVHTVTFAEYKFDYRAQEGALWGWEIVLREEL